MPTNTYVALDKVTVGTAVNQVTFTSIPQGYTDLVIVMNNQIASGGNDNILYQFNGDTGSNYSGTSLIGNGSAASSDRASNTVSYVAGRVGSAVNSTSIFQVQNYSNTTTNKTSISRANVSDTAVFAFVGLWRSTAAITSIRLYTASSVNFNVGSTFSLYGISAIGGVTPKATGGTVTSDANYWYHTFEMSGNFVPNQSLTCDYLVVAGGGGGGNATENASTPSYRGGGGGGAGGLRCTVGATGGGGTLETALSVTAQSYAITVGGGGAGSSSQNVAGSNGSNSTFSTITSTGGGGGGTTSASGGNGGSGGGRGHSSASVRGTGTTNQGYAAGATNVDNNPPYIGTSGGGAGAIGGSAVASPAGINAGGVGVATSISGTSVTYAGGGAGIGTNATSGVPSTIYTAAGGSGGGAASAQTPTAATINTGGGGGAGLTAGSNGGSGIVIIRYAK